MRLLSRHGESSRANEGGGKAPAGGKNGSCSVEAWDVLRIERGGAGQATGAGVARLDGRTTFVAGVEQLLLLQEGVSFLEVVSVLLRQLEYPTILCHVSYLLTGIYVEARRMRRFDRRRCWAGSRGCAVIRENASRGGSGEEMVWRDSSVFREVGAFL